MLIKDKNINLAPHILVVDDDKRLNNLLEKYINKETIKILKKASRTYLNTCINYPEIILSLIRSITNQIIKESKYSTTNTPKPTNIGMKINKTIPDIKKETKQLIFVGIFFFTRKNIKRLNTPVKRIATKKLLKKSLINLIY